MRYTKTALLTFGAGLVLAPRDASSAAPFETARQNAHAPHHARHAPPRAVAKTRRAEPPLMAGVAVDIKLLI